MNSVSGVLKEAKRILVEYHCEIFIICAFFYLGVHVLYYAYYRSVYISPDSADYLLEAEAILDGYGFNMNGIAGHDGWFSSWPIGYPFLIASISFVTGWNVYLSSKVLSILIVAACFGVLYMRSKKAAWIYVLAFFNAGFLDNIYLYTWSENPFILAQMVFGFALTEVIQKDVPKKRWFLILGGSSIAAFLSRYFGAMTLILLVCVTAFYLIRYRFDKNSDDDSLKGTVSGLLITDITVSLVILSYLSLNKVMSGKMSGVDRLLFKDDLCVLTKELFDALVQELYNATRIEMPLVIAELGLYGKLLFTVICVVFIAYFCYDEIKKSVDHKAVFILLGIFYYIVFIIIRFRSSMDTFGSRFFAPASMLISIGILGCIQKKIERYQCRICAALSIMLIFLSVAICRDIGKCSPSDIAYHRFESEIRSSLETVPEKSTIIAYDGEYRAKVARPDIYYAGVICETDTVDDLFERYSGSDHICIRAKDVKNILVNDLEQANPLYSFFGGFVEQETDEEGYIVISVKDDLRSRGDEE